MGSFSERLFRYSPKQRKIIKAYQHLFDMNNAVAKDVLLDMMKHGHMFESTFVEGKQEEGVMLLQEGERNFVLRILTILNLSPDEILDRVLETEEPEVTDDQII